MPTASDLELYKRFAEEAFLAGRPDVAAECLRRAAAPAAPAAPGEDARQLAREANALQQQGKLREAESLLLRAVQLLPHDAGWYDNLGVILARQGRIAEGIACLRVSLRLNPQDGMVWNNVAHLCRETKNVPAAIEAFRQAVLFLPQDKKPRLALIELLKEQQLLGEAETVAREAVKKFPDDPQVVTELALILNAAGRYEDALPHFIRVAELVPHLADAHSNLSAVYGRMKRWEECERTARAALAINPNQVKAWSNLGNCLRDMGKFVEAEEALRAALRLNPTDPDAAGNLALTLANQARYTDAIRAYDRALELKPDNHDVRFNRGLALLTLGDYEHGLADYESRWHTEQLKNLEKRYPVPKWDGSSLKGRTIFVHTEQGFGDTLQFVRLVQLLEKQGATVVMHPGPELSSIMRTVPGITRLIEGERAEVVFDCHTPLMSLPYHLGIRLETLPQQVPYFTAPQEAVEKWRQRLKDVPGFKVGIAWQGNTNFPGDRWRSVKLKEFAPLAAVPGVTLCSLQVSDARKQISEVGFPVLDLGGELAKDFGDTAGLMMNLDLVISTCTSVVHLAGGLGVPMWVALSANPDWRWLRDRDDSPWYPSARLFRQKKLLDWSPVFEQMASELRTAAFAW